MSEGIAREFINKIQNERKNISLEVTDKIEIQIENKESFIIESLSKHKDFISNEVQALKFLITENINESNIMDLNIHNLESSSNSINYLIKKL